MWICLVSVGIPGPASSSSPLGVDMSLSVSVGIPGPASSSSPLGVDMSLSVSGSPSK